MKGLVKWYNARKGYGFITPDDKSADVFVHATSLKNCGLKKLYTGSEVSYEIDEDEKGKRAKSIKVTKEVKLETNKKDEKKDEKKEVKKDEKKEVKKEAKKEVKKEVKKKEVKKEKKTQTTKSKESKKK